MRAFLYDMIEQLEQMPEQQRHSTSSTVRAWRAENRPLLDRVRDIVDTIPLEVQREGVPLRTIQEQVRGKRPGRNAHNADVAQALRQLGFRRDRRWRDEDQGFSALWVRDLSHHSVRN